MRVKTKAFLIAAPRSGAGKTTVTLALLAAFRRRGLAVRAAKCGPDYIDPAFHAEAAGAPCLNLDSWAMGPALLDSIAYDASAGADLLIVESAMGLFDGVRGGAIGEGSAAELAVHLRLPVLLVLDVAGQAQSAAASVLGFASFDPRVRIAGIVLNRVGSDRHRASVERAIGTLDIPLSAPSRATRRSLPERHLGLVQALEHNDLELRLHRLADLAGRHCDLATFKVSPLFKVDQRPVAALRRRPAHRARVRRPSLHVSACAGGWHRAGAEIVTSRRIR
jgi:cobyrinic acid a,c-diamide synthase